MGQPVVHWEIICRDGTVARSFYQRAFGWQFDEPSGGYSMVTADSTRGINGSCGETDGEWTGLLVYIETSDVASQLRAVEAFGAHVVLSATRFPNGLVIGQFVDPIGNRIGLIETRSAR